MPPLPLSRRHLLLGAAATAATALIAACGGNSSATDTPKPVVPTVAPVATLGISPSPTAASIATAPPTTAPIATTTAAPAGTATTAPTAIATPVASGTVAPVEPGDLIKETQGRFTFTGPKGWVANPDPISPIVVQLRTENPFRSVSVRESAPTEGKTLEQFDKDTLAVAKTNGGYRAGTRVLQPTTLGGEPAIIDDFVTSGNGITGYNFRVLCIRQGILYTVNFGSDPQTADALQPVVKLVLDTWKFL